jgi:hypothetical protein
LAIPIARPPAPAKSSTLRIEKPPDPPLEPLRVSQLTFPDGQHLPALSRKGPLVPCVPSAITFQLPGPEIKARLGHARERAIRVTVPEASVHKDDFVFPPKHKIWTAWQILLMEMVAVAEGGYKLTDKYLRPRVL